MIKIYPSFKVLMSKYFTLKLLPPNMLPFVLVSCKNYHPKYKIWFAVTCSLQFIGAKVIEKL